MFDLIPQAAEDKKHTMETAYQPLGRSSFFQADLGYFLVVPSPWKVLFGASIASLPQTQGTAKRLAAGLC